MLRALHVALRGQGATIVNDHLYLGDEWVARVNYDHVELRGVTAFNGHRDVWTHQPYRVTETCVPDVVAMIDERRKARGEVPCAA